MNASSWTLCAKMPLTWLSVNPTRVRAFAKSEEIKAKTDPIDAALLLRFAQSKKQKPTPPLSDQQRTFQALMDRRSQLTESLTREKNRLEKCPECIRKSIDKIIGILEEELACIDEQIEQLIDEGRVKVVSPRFHDF